MSAPACTDRRTPRRAGVWHGAGLSLAVLLALAAPALPQAPPPAEPSAPGAGPPPLVGGETRAPVDVTGASEITYDAQTEQYTFRGERVVVVRGDQRLTATEIRYNGAQRVAVLPHGGTVSTPTMELQADQMTADLGRRHFVADGSVAGRFLDEGVWASLRAAHLVADDRPDLRAAEAAGGVVVTRNDRELRGDRVVYDRLRRHGTAEGSAVLTRSTDRLRADRIAADLGTDDAQASGHVGLDRKSGAEELHGSGDAATYSGRTQTAVLTGHAAVVRGKDTVTAERITMHFDTNEAIADGRAVLVGYPKEGSSGAEESPGPLP